MKNGFFFFHVNKTKYSFWELYPLYSIEFQMYPGFTWICLMAGCQSKNFSIYYENSIVLFSDLI